MKQCLENLNMKFAYYKTVMHLSTSFNCLTIIIVPILNYHFQELIYNNNAYAYYNVIILHIKYL